MMFGSVCSGIEAASVAWHPLGWETAFVSEIEKFPCAVLKHHYPDVPNFGDMTRFKDWPDAALDVLVGGTPCQSFSVAGLRKGLADPRGNLTLVYLAIADRYRPRWLVWENVPGILSIDGGRAFGALLGGLAQLGYGFAYRVLDAQHFGVPQRRRRVFVVGYLGDWRRAAAVLFERHSLQGNPPPSREAGEEAAHALRGRANASHREDSDNYISHALGASHTRSGRMDPSAETFIASTLRAESGRNQVESNYIAHSLRADGFDASEDGTGRGTPLAVTPINLQVATRHNALGRGTGFGVGEPGEAAFTVGANHSHAIATMLPFSAVRRLTPKEASRLQGFPDDYLDITYRGKPAADGPRYKSLGNSMAVPCMRWLGERIAAVDTMK